MDEPPRRPSTTRPPLPGDTPGSAPGGAPRQHTTARPRGKRPPPRRPPVPQWVYWIRRTVALVIVLAVLALIVFAVVGVSRLVSSALASSDAGEGQGSAQSADAGDTGPQPCSPDDLSLALSGAKQSVAAGQAMAFTVSMEYDGEADCTVDAGLTERVVTVHSGSDDIWSSAHCDDAGSRALLFSTGDKDEISVPWNTVRSDKECSSDLPALREGTYYAVVSYAGKSSQRVVFQVTDG
ncbi:hypothetical protein [Jonesia quinghaiensis]|uniref:hypothetical protein n=1 Tax=Jonesia quinghaiensis TaxID=262806 RepID=UPI0012F8207A|nr:hypothetical protein [Jonesia quinghaiensis]